MIGERCHAIPLGTTDEDEEEPEISSLNRGLSIVDSNVLRHSAATSSMAIGNLVAGPVASGSGVVPPGVSFAEGHQQAAPKRKRLAQPKAAPVPHMRLVSLGHREIPPE
ncbi:Protein of unknown function [Pyronema omphalodes CBS 100304]|uniref:Uncharacterized protein n=1 Tax=Pyronema omphalodes (strain CBS 100304) TaxID=1076935 RepID=U4LHI0_PYROM|nr:Protein of unknown function [Pyronema omphalodes CBS 100304]